MLNFFDAIIDYIELIWGYFMNFINTTLTTIMTLASVSTFLTNAINFFPSILVTSAVIVIAIVVARFILGR